MLVTNSKYKPGDIMSFKISNGDEIVAYFVDEYEHSFTIDKPMALVPAQNGISLMNSLLSADADQKYTLRKDHIILYGKTADRMADHYREVTTGITTVRKGGIITG